MPLTVDPSHAIARKVAQSGADIEAITADDATNTPPEVMKFKGEWVDGTTYYPYDVVMNGPYQAIANVQTVEEPAIVPIAAPRWYSGFGDNPSWTPFNVVASSSFSLLRVDYPQSSFVDAIRLWVDPNDTAINRRHSFSIVTDPAGPNPTVDLVLVSGIVEDSGWLTVPISARLLIANTVYDFVHSISLFGTTDQASGPWAYARSTNVQPPLSGTINHASNNANILRMHYVDDNATDHAAILSALAPGDTIWAAGQTWTVSGTNPQINWTELTVVPATRLASDMTTTFSITHQTGTIDLHHPYIFNHYAGDARAQGGYSDTGQYADLLLSELGFGADFHANDVRMPNDWTILSITNVG